MRTLLPITDVLIGSVQQSIPPLALRVRFLDNKNRNVLTSASEADDYSQNLHEAASSGLCAMLVSRVILGSPKYTKRSSMSLTRADLHPRYHSVSTNIY